MTSLHDHRLAELHSWLDSVLGPERSFTLSAASSDASFRRYFRVTLTQEGGSLIAMDAPPERESCAQFVAVAKLFSDANVPRILAQNISQGFLLLEDFGPTTMLDHISADPQCAPALYRQAIDSLLSIQTLSEPNKLPDYSDALLRQEMALFPDWFMQKHLGITWSQTEQKIWQDAQELLLKNIHAQTKSYVHRDFHSRNLMVQAGSQKLGILDFQDAVHGPITYDLVSLLKDAYITWPEDQILDGVVRYWEQAKKAKLAVPVHIDAFYQDFEWMGIQRHLKVAGIFARLYYRDGKSAYLNDLPVVLSYLYQATRRYSALTDLHQMLHPYISADKERKTLYTF